MKTIIATFLFVIALAAGVSGCRTDDDQPKTERTAQQGGAAGPTAVEADLQQQMGLDDEEVQDRRKFYAELDSAAGAKLSPAEDGTGLALTGAGQCLQIYNWLCDVRWRCTAYCASKGKSCVKTGDYTSYCANRFGAVVAFPMPVGLHCQ